VSIRADRDEPGALQLGHQGVQLGIVSRLVGHQLRVAAGSY
jgi:hypothetical protein